MWQRIYGGHRSVVRKTVIPADDVEASYTAVVVEDVKTFGPGDHLLLRYDGDVNDSFTFTDGSTAMDLCGMPKS